VLQVPRDARIAAMMSVADPRPDDYLIMLTKQVPILAQTKNLSPACLRSRMAASWGLPVHHARVQAHHAEPGSGGAYIGYCLPQGMVKRTPLEAFATVRGTLTAIKLRVRTSPSQSGCHKRARSPPLPVMHTAQYAECECCCLWRYCPMEGGHSRV
jgi:hypothetical protein